MIKIKTVPQFVFKNCIITFVPLMHKTANVLLSVTWKQHISGPIVLLNIFFTNAVHPEIISGSLHNTLYMIIA